MAGALAGFVDERRAGTEGDLRMGEHGHWRKALRNHDEVAGHARRMGLQGNEDAVGHTHRWDREGRREGSDHHICLGYRRTRAVEYGGGNRPDGGCTREEDRDGHKTHRMEHHPVDIHGDLQQASEIDNGLVPYHLALPVRCREPAA